MLVRLALAALAALAGAGAAAPLAAQPRVPIQRYTLANGLTVVLAEDHSAPVVAVNVTYDVGSRVERPGRTGFAHLFEHMMFEGSAHVGRGEHFARLVAAGTSGMNGETHEDYTSYYQPVPSHQMALALWLEADRMRSLTITPENFETQRKAVQEERRQKLDNQPYAAAVVEGQTGAVDSAGCFPYSHSVFGAMSDLAAATVEDARAFFATYYVPNNATLVIAGDFAAAEARRLVARHFGTVPRGRPVPPPAACALRPDAGPRRVTVRDARASLPATVQTYTIPATGHADHAALQLWSIILGRGETARLHRTLVRANRAAVAAQALVNAGGPRRGPGQFTLLAIANGGVGADSLDRLLTAEVARAAETVTADELAKAKRVVRATASFGRQTALELSHAIQRAHLFLGGPEMVNADLARFDRVTLDDLRRVARTYLRPANVHTQLVVTGAS